MCRRTVNIVCPRCQFETYVSPGENFPMPSNGPCVYLQEQIKSSGKITDAMCPHLLKEIDWRVYGRRD
jgi:hypothetical protein